MWPQGGTDSSEYSSHIWFDINSKKINSHNMHRHNRNIFYILAQILSIFQSKVTDWYSDVAVHLVFLRMNRHQLFWQQYSSFSNKFMTEWPWRNRSCVHNPHPHASDQLCHIWYKSIQNCIQYRADRGQSDRWTDRPKGPGELVNAGFPLERTCKGLTMCMGFTIRLP